MVNRLEHYWPRVLPPAFSDDELERDALRSCTIELVLVLRGVETLSNEELCQVTQIVETLAERFEQLRNR